MVCVPALAAPDPAADDDLSFGDISYIGRTNGVCVIFLKRELTLSFFGICLLVCSQLMGVVMSRILLYICT